jgi:hypothetical protein
MCLSRATRVTISEQTRRGAGYLLKQNVESNASATALFSSSQWGDYERLSDVLRVLKFLFFAILTLPKATPLLLPL